MKVGDVVEDFVDFQQKCLTMEYVDKHLKQGDKVLICITDSFSNNVIRELEFDKYVHCVDSVSYILCDHCQGKKLFKGLGDIICGNYGYITNIYKILDGINLLDDMDVMI